MKRQLINLIILACLLLAGQPCAAFDLDFLPEVSQVSSSTDLGSSTEQHSRSRTSLPWLVDPQVFAADQGDLMETQRVLVEQVETVKLTDLVPPILFGEGDVEIPDDYLARLRVVLGEMRDKKNVRLHFVGHADSQRLSPELQEIYTDNLGLSRERAGVVAEYCQRELNLPAAAISYEGLGDSRPVASNETPQGQSRNRRVEVELWYDRIVEVAVEKELPVPRDVTQVKICRTETVCKLSYKEGHAHRARLRNLVPPLAYENGMVEVPESYLRQLLKVYQSLRTKQRVQLKFIAYTDNTALSARQQRIYGNHAGLSSAVARRTAQAVQDALQLANPAVASEGRGATRPLATNLTVEGRARNRRIEVEFWHDDPLQGLPDEPQLCPEQSGADTVTRVYQSPNGALGSVLFENGQPLISDQALSSWRRALAEISGKANPRLRFVGYVSNERLDRRTAAVYGDDIGLSLARARRAMEEALARLDLSPEQAEFDGRGYVQSEDVVNLGFIESDQSRVEVQAVYDELAIIDDYDGVEITRLTRNVETKNPFALNLMRISVDGTPVDDPGKSVPDVQRCTDVALDAARIQFKYDSLTMEPRLNVNAWPRAARFADYPDSDFPENRIDFQLYSNYRNFFSRAEVRIFRKEQAETDEPLVVVDLDDLGRGHWLADFSDYRAPGIKLKYLLRVSSEEGLFDETRPQELWIVDQLEPESLVADRDYELLAGYGGSRIAFRNIPLRGGVIQAIGEHIPAEHAVWLAGKAVPVDGRGRFIAEEIIPSGAHTVEVAVLDPQGNGNLYLRDLQLKDSDWFTVGIADLTASANETNGPAHLLDPDNPRYSEDFSLQGRLAFYSKGRLANGWTLTASADTREGPLDEIFSNFMEKTSDAQFRRMDPDRHYPTLGDDSTVVEDAPTRGKFYLRMQRDDNYALWGNYKLSYRDAELTPVERNLYGLHLHYQPTQTTSFGATRFLADGFIADPGTVSGRDDLRGTGGSLYYLKFQDVLEGSESVRIEVRDKDSNLVIASKLLSVDLDYDIDYLQGRILLNEVLPTTADDNLLTSSASISGNPVYLVVQYEYTPGFSDPDTVVSGARVHYWLNDFIKFGATRAMSDEPDAESRISGVDLVLRKSSASWLKLEYARSEGDGVLSSSSDDGGYSYSTETTTSAENSASGYRAEASLAFSDIHPVLPGQLHFYLQDLGAGYSVTGLSTETGLTQYGFSLGMPIGQRFSTRVKYDKKSEEELLETEAGEINLDYRLTDNWTLSSGVRQDTRTVLATTTSSTQEEGELIDVVVRASYNSRKAWSAYSFVQETIEATDSREDNSRLGLGGSWRLTERFSLHGEVSEGDLGTDATVGSEYLYSDRTTLYLNYSLDNESGDDGSRSNKGNMASGFRTRYSDTTSVYFEETYAHGDTPTGLIHTAGVDLAPTDRLNLKVSLDIGTLKDPETSATLERTAGALSVGYGFDKVALASGVEYRVDNTEQSDDSHSKRTTWLFKNSFKYKLNENWRILGKFNMSMSESSLGSSYNGDYTEAVLGYAYRPVYNDRLNLLFKYTYFYDLPATDDSSSSTTTYIQRSHIAAVDLMYDLTQRWTIGGKYAYRLGQVALDRENPQYFDSNAQLFVLRADWHFMHRWDALVEGRMLDLPDAQDRRAGALVGVYRHFGNHIKAGLGYNFSDFSDDLTQLDYRHQGLFVNLIGKF